MKWLFLFWLNSALAGSFEHRAEAFLMAQNQEDLQLRLDQVQALGRCRMQIDQKEIPTHCYLYNRTANIKLNAQRVLKSCLQGVENSNYEQLAKTSRNLIPQECRNAIALRIKELEYVMEEQNPSYYIK